MRITRGGAMAEMNTVEHHLTKGHPRPTRSIIEPWKSTRRHNPWLDRNLGPQEKRDPDEEGASFDSQKGKRKRPRHRKVLEKEGDGALGDKRVHGKLNDGQDH